jgi:hypothetical protein
MNHLGQAGSPRETESCRVDGDVLEGCLTRARKVAGVERAVRVLAGTLVSCALRDDHALLCWGGARDGVAKEMDGVAQAALEDDALCAVRDDGKVTCERPQWRTATERTPDDAPLDASFVAGVHASNILLGRDGTACAARGAGRAEELHVAPSP